MSRQLPGSLGSFPLSRRTALRAAGAGLLLSGAASRVKAAPQSTPVAAVPVSGDGVPDLAVFDGAVLKLMGDWGLPGAQLSVGYEGRLVLSRGYGYADTEAGETVQPDHRYRIASVSKTLTTVGILRLVDAGRLTLEDKAFPLIGFEPPLNAPVDPRLAEITIGELLVHAGGWDTPKSGDPQSPPLVEMAAWTFALDGPPPPQTIVRYMLGEPLDFDPGTKSIYSNFGFNVLGRVIEAVSGQPYETFTQEQVLGPAGANALQIARTRREDRAENEVVYYQPAGLPVTVPSVFPGEGFMPLAYGSFYIEAMDSHGGWIANTPDLIRFVTAIDGQRGDELLKPATVEKMLTAPRPKQEWYNGAANMLPCTGLGWVSQPGKYGMEWSHTGALGGSNAALVLRNEQGMSLAFATNTLPVDFVGWFAALYEVLTDAGYAVSTWPSHDLFEEGV